MMGHVAEHATKTTRSGRGTGPALEIRDVVLEYPDGTTAEDKQVLNLFGSTAEIGRALMTPPELPADRLAVLQKAMADMLADPGFKDELTKRNLEFGPMSGSELQKVMGQTLDVSPAVIERSIALSRQQ